VVRDLHDGAQQRLVHTILTLKPAHGALHNDGEDLPALLTEALDQAEQATASPTSRNNARAGRATVTARVEDGTFRVQVRDDGIGGAWPSSPQTSPSPASSRDPVVDRCSLATKGAHRRRAGRTVPRRYSARTSRRRGSALAEGYFIDRCLQVERRQESVRSLGLDEPARGVRNLARSIVLVVPRGMRRTETASRETHRGPSVKSEAQ
jgi:hypothetical protein